MRHTRFSRGNYDWGFTDGDALGLGLGVGGMGAPYKATGCGMQPATIRAVAPMMAARCTLSPRLGFPSRQKGQAASEAK